MKLFLRLYFAFLILNQFTQMVGKLTKISRFRSSAYPRLNRPKNISPTSYLISLSAPSVARFKTISGFEAKATPISTDYFLPTECSIDETEKFCNSSSYECTLLDLSPGRTYQVKAKTKMKGKAFLFKGITISTEIGEPGPSRDVTLSLKVLSNSCTHRENKFSAMLEASWKYPCEPNGNLSYFEVELIEKSSNIQETADYINQKIIYISDHGIEIFKTSFSSLNSSSLYVVTIKAGNVDGFTGKEASNQIETPQDCPMPPKQISHKKISPSKYMISWNKPTKSDKVLEHYVYAEEIGPMYYHPSDCRSNVTHRTNCYATEDQSCYLNDLKPGSAYAVRIAAKNSMGLGPKSSKLVLSTPPEVLEPEPPRNLRLELLNLLRLCSNESNMLNLYNATLKASWSYPCKPNGNLSHFLVYMKGYFAEYFSFEKVRQIHIKSNVDEYETVFTNLNASFVYKISILSVNREGIFGKTTTEQIKSPRECPTAPELSTVEVTSTSCFISWKESIPNDQVLNYKVRAIPESNKLAPQSCQFDEKADVVTCETKKLNCKLSNLRPNHRYQVILTTEYYNETSPALRFSVITKANGSAAVNNLKGDVMTTSISCDKFNSSFKITWDHDCDASENLRFLVEIEGRPNTTTAENVTYQKQIYADFSPGEEFVKEFVSLNASTVYNVSVFSSGDNNGRSFIVGITPTCELQASYMTILASSTLYMTLIGAALLFALILITSASVFTLKKSKRRQSFKSPNIRLNKFSSYYENIVNNPNILEKQFSNLTRFQSKGTNNLTTVASKEQNIWKNRLRHQLPYDSTRVKLKVEYGLSDYINASYIKGYHKEKEYIVTQAPMENTILDFWFMVIQEKVSLIVMLCLFHDSGENICPKYFPGKKKILQIDDDIEIHCTSAVCFDNYCLRNLIVKINSNNSKLNVTHMQLFHWPITSPIPLIDFCASVREKSLSSPVIVHCRDGMGRSGVFVAVDILVQTLKFKPKRKKINIYDVVLNLRRQRPNMVETKEQYLFIHTCMVFVIQDLNLAGDTKEENHLYQNVPEFILDMNEDSD